MQARKVQRESRNGVHIQRVEATFPLIRCSSNEGKDILQTTAVVLEKSEQGRDIFRSQEKKLKPEHLIL